MASTQQALLQPLHKNRGKCEILFLFLSIFAVMITPVFLLPDYLTNRSPTPVFHDFCRIAMHPITCQSFISELVSADDVKHSPLDATTLLQKFLINQSHLMKSTILQTRKLKNQMNEQEPLSDCVELIDLSIDHVFNSIKALENQTSASDHANAQSWLSGVLTNHVTCFDGLSSSARKHLGATMEDLISRARASLAMLVAISELDNEMIKPLRGNLPSWVTTMDTKLLQSRANAVKADLTVAKDGTGNYKTLAEAVAAAPDNSKNRYVIHVKKGTYKENVEVGKSKQNLMIIGDGMDSTIITGDRYSVDGSRTFGTATLGVVGEGFILQDIRIQNTAGPEKHQAVALRVGGDRSVVHRCHIDAYQDTLYTYSNRQFYRDCYITGTVDFIFGDAAVVLQKCKLVARKPMKGQKNMVTAQGRTDPAQNSGISIQDCDIIASDDLEPVKSSYKTYLGRPWKEYSRTVVMQSKIGDHVDPAGWSEWSGDFALKTLYYGEFRNTGPGSKTSQRVNWTGYHVIKDPAVASHFTVKELIQGGDWLGPTGVPFTEGL